MNRRMAWLATLLLILTGCTSSPPPPESPSESATPMTEKEPNAIVVGVDSLKGGFNPHQLADTSTTTSALAQVMLPSVFSRDDQGKPTLDKTVMRSAKVVSSSPFTVQYQIRQDASWSDGAPIAAEAFSYLADVMRTQPGTADSAGYRLISDVQSRDGGKRVVVKFESRYPGWRSLFANLLPAHLLKDAPGGWQEAMQDGYPASGGPFAIKGIDDARGEILLERNERYWEKPAAVDQLVLRRSDDKTVASALRDGDTQFALTRSDAATDKALRGLGKAAELEPVPRPEVAEVVLRPTSDVLADPSVRAAMAAFLDRGRLIEAGGGDPNRPADSQVTAPSEPSYRASIPRENRGPDPERAAQLLADAGYARTSGHWTDSEGKSLTVEITAPKNRRPYVDIAKETVRQLAAAGVDAELRQIDGRALLGTDPTERSRQEEETTTSTEPSAPADDSTSDEESDVDGVDMLVAPRPVGVDGASTVASRVGCGGATASGDDEEIVPGNVSGYCDTELEALLEQLLTGQREWSSGAAEVDSALWSANVSVPLFQLTDTLAVTPYVSGVNPGAPLAGPFDSAVNWLRTK